jgi:phosphate/sulfate permease
MLRYFYKWTPLIIVGTVVLLSLPWLGLIALIIVSLVALPALAFAVAYVPYMLIRTISRSLQGASGSRTRSAPVLTSATRQPNFRKEYVS